MNYASTHSLLLGAIFPSLHPSTITEIVRSTDSLQHALHRAGHICHPTSTLGKTDEEADDILRIHEVYLSHTCIGGVQVSDASHHHEYDATVTPVMCDTFARDQAALESASRGDCSEEPSGKEGGSNAPFTPIGKAAERRRRRCPAMFGCESDSDLCAKVIPQWRTSAHSGKPGRRCPMYDDHRWVRSTTPLDPYANIFSCRGNKCSLAALLNVPDVNFSANFAAAKSTAIRAIVKVLSGNTLLSSQENLPIAIPFEGKCLVSISAVRIDTLEIDPDKVLLEVIQVGSSDTGDDGATHEPMNEQDTPLVSNCLQKLRVKVKGLLIRIHPISLVISHGRTDKNPIKENVKIKGSKLKIELVGDVLLSPAGKHSFSVDDAKLRIGKLSLKFDSTGRNILVAIAKPILVSQLQKEAENALKGKHSI